MAGLGIGPGNEYANGRFAGFGAGCSTRTPLPGSSSHTLMVPSGADGLVRVLAALREVLDLVLATSDIPSSTDLWNAQHHQSKYPPAKPGALVLEPLKAACPCRTRQSVPSTLWNAPHLMTCSTPMGVPPAEPG